MNMRDQIKHQVREANKRREKKSSKRPAPEQLDENCPAIRKLRKKASSLKEQL